MSERLSFHTQHGNRRAPDISRYQTKIDDVQSKRFVVEVCQSETSGTILDTLRAGRKASIVLGLSPTSSSANRTRLRTILEWLIPRTEHITVLDGYWFHRWDLVALDGLSIKDATTLALQEMQRLHRRVITLSLQLGANDKVSLTPWPETHDLSEVRSIRSDLVRAIQESPRLAEALHHTTDDYLAHVRKHDERILSHHYRTSLLNYVIEEVSVFVFMSLRVSTVEVYPGPDLSLMRRLAAGEFRDVFPYNLSNRSHLSLEVIELAEGRLRDGNPCDWLKIEKLVRAWPTHFVDEALPLVRTDFFNCQTVVCENETGQVLGFMIWRTDGREMELLWMAVEPSRVRRGIGRGIVKAALCRRSREHRVFLRTATPDSVIPSTLFSGSAYHATIHFFESLGFTVGARFERYWGPTNHMVEMQKSYNSSDSRG